MPRYKRHGQERSKQHCTRCGKETRIDDEGRCKQCRRTDRAAKHVEENADA